MKVKDFYHILGVQVGASYSEIHTAFRQKAMECHPDRNSTANAEQLFIDVVEAWEVLSDAKKREQYDAVYVLTIVSSRSKEVLRQKLKKQILEAARSKSYMRSSFGSFGKLERPVLEKRKEKVGRGEEA